MYALMHCVPIGTKLLMRYLSIFRRNLNTDLFQYVSGIQSVVMPVSAIVRRDKLSELINYGVLGCKQSSHLIFSRLK